MYDELVKRLREVEEMLRVAQFNEAKSLIKQAADIIEELSKYTNHIGRMKCEGWYLQQTKYRDGYHAVATMPLPEPPKEE